MKFEVWDRKRSRFDVFFAYFTKLRRGAIDFSRVEQSGVCRGDPDMGMTSNQIRLCRSVAQNDTEAARKYAMACCAEDTTQKNAYSIQAIKNLLSSSPVKMMELPSDIQSFAKLEDLEENGYLENRYYLAEPERKTFELIRDMNDVSLKLMERHIPYVNATLLFGESGCGKTEFSKYVAYKLGLPYLYINFSQMLDPHLGGTAKNLSRLFDFINKQKCVVMMDEIDCVATNRKYASSDAGAEVSRSVTCLLQCLDQITNDHVILAATNMLDSIDRAVVRRFTEVHEIKRMSAEDNEKFIRQYLDDAKIPYDTESVSAFAKQDHSQAEITKYMTRQIAQMMLKKQEKIVL